jgi:hypothetical protein
MYNYNNEVEAYETDRACSKNWKMNGAYKLLLGRPEECGQLKDVT